jgi:malate dehydrogenase (quinone)
MKIPKKAMMPEVDVVLVGAGIMSATLGTLLKELDPRLSIQVFERLDHVAKESSFVMNNAGTGHAALCELNYTPLQADGSVNIAKAVAINELYETSLQFWAYLVAKNALPKPANFITRVPHSSFVWGEENVMFLKKRFEAMRLHPFFQNMSYSDDIAELTEWMPLIMKGRDHNQKVAATRIGRGTDVNFSEVTTSLFAHLDQQADLAIHLNHEVKNLVKEADGRWRLIVKDLESDETHQPRAKFVFLGAGGRAQLLLHASGIPERQGYASFPVSGQFLVCHNPAVIEQHHAKVYGKAALGAPPMSVPHLDTRIIHGNKSLLFGPYAGFTTKFLKKGSWWDLATSINGGNILPLLGAGWSNLDLTAYLIGQGLQSQASRIRALHEYMPTADPADWKLSIAGQRVQIIKKDPKKWGKLEFGTEVVTAADGSLAALLGASPGASTAVSAMIDLIERCFKTEAQSAEWQAAFRRMIPAYGQSLAKNPALHGEVCEAVDRALGLQQP